jgi:hypothetical protein
MHVLHWVAVKIDETIGEDGVDLDEAKSCAVSEVNYTLQGDERPYADWYDWFVVGGGRFLGDKPYDTSHENVIAFADDPKGFSKTIREALESRAQEIRRRLDEIKDKEKKDGKSFEERVEDYITYTESGSTEFPFDPLMVMYQYSCVSRLASEFWVPDTYFYDLSNGTTETRYLLRDLEQSENGDNWFLVPVDFHF